MTESHKFLSHYSEQHNFRRKEQAIARTYLGHAAEFKNLPDDEARVLADILSNQTIDQVKDAIKKMWSEGVEPESSIELAHNDDVVNKEVTAEDGEVIQITQELRDEFLMDHGKIEGAFWQVAFALSRIRRNKSYLAGGFTSFEQYAEKSIPVSVRQAYAYALVGDAYEKYEKKMIEGHGPNLGISKVKLIASKGEEQVKRLIEKGEIQVGKEIFTQEELENETIKSLRARLKLAEDEAKKNKEKAGKTELLEEKLKNAKMEKEHLEEFYKEHSQLTGDVEQMTAEMENAWWHVVEARKIFMKMDLDSYDVDSRELHPVVDSYMRLAEFMERTASFVKNQNYAAAVIWTEESEDNVSETIDEDIIAKYSDKSEGGDEVDG